MAGPTVTDTQRARKTVILAVVHALLAVAILAGFVFMQMRA